jgi:hypothetical protein
MNKIKSTDCIYYIWENKMTGVPNRANIKFAPTSDAGFLSIVGTNLVFVRS